MCAHSTQGLVDRFNLFAKSMPKGSVPKLNTGVKKSSRAATKPAKGFHKIYRCARIRVGGVVGYG